MCRFARQAVAAYAITAGSLMGRRLQACPHRPHRSLLRCHWPRTRRDLAELATIAHIFMLPAAQAVVLLYLFLEQRCVNMYDT
jgi:hypothetical protein